MQSGPLQQDFAMWPDQWDRQANLGSEHDLQDFGVRVGLDVGIDDLRTADRQQALHRAAP
jgi:hypothetical protein